jgi:isocitrate lyase
MHYLFYIYHFFVLIESIFNQKKKKTDRAIAFRPYADLLWMETSVPHLKDAKEFAEGVKRVYPNAMLAYNLSPSFNWSAHGMTDSDIENYTKQLASYGFVWQFITVAGNLPPPACVCVRLGVRVRVRWLSVCVVRRHQGSTRTV